MRNGNQRPREHPALLATSETVITLLVVVGGWFAWYLAVERYHLTSRQVAEFACYLVIAFTSFGSVAYVLATTRSRREKEWPHPPLVITRQQDERAVGRAANQGAVVLGYDIHKKPWLWPDRVRVMQGIVLGMTGSGKTTLLRNIITQDLCRLVGPPEDRHHVPM